MVRVDHKEKVSRNLKEVMQLSEGKAFMAEGTASVKALKQKHTLYAQRIVWKSMCLDGSKQGGK